MADLPKKLLRQLRKEGSRRPGDPTQAYGAILDAETKRDLDSSVIGVFIGILFTVITGFPSASPLLTAFLRDELGISNSAYGLIMTLPYLTVLIQIPFSVYVGRHGRVKQAFILFAMLNKLSFVVPALMTLMATKPNPTVAALLIGVVMLLSSTFNWIAESSLFTWFGAMIPVQIKGRYLSTRQMIYTAGALGYSLALSVALRFTDTFAYKYTLFFLLASFTGVLDILMYLRIRPPERSFYPFVPNPAAKGRLKLSEFAKPFRNPNYRAFLLFATGWSFAIGLTSPYFNVYLLRDLHVSLGIQMLLQQILPYVATILFMRRIGRLNDSFGYKPMLTLSCWIVAFMPLTWILTTPDTYWYIGITNFLSGIFNVAIDLAIMSLAIFLAPHEDRATFLAGKSISVSLLGIVPAILIGGQLTDWLTPILAQANISLFEGHTVSSFHVLLVISAIIRLAVVVFFLRRLREENAPQISITPREFSSMMRFSVARRLTMLRQIGRTIKRRYLVRRGSDE